MGYGFAYFAWVTHYLKCAYPDNPRLPKWKRPNQYFGAFAATQGR